MNLLSVEPTINTNSLKALFIGCEIANKPNIAEGLRREFDLDYVKLPNHYPFDRYLQMLDWLRRQLYPLEKETTGYEKIGRNITRGFFQGPLGQVLKLSIPVMGTQRSVRYFFRVAGGALSFGKFEIIEERPNFVRAALYNVPGSPELMRGMSLESMNFTSAKQPSVTYTKLSPNDTEFIARWLD